MGETVVSGCNSAEVLEAAEHALDGVAVAIEIWREAIFPAAVDLGRDLRRGAPTLDFATDGIAVVPFVAMQDVEAPAVQQRIGRGAVSDLAAGQQERNWAAGAIGQRMDFRRPPTAGTADRLREFPPLPPEAQR